MFNFSAVITAGGSSTRMNGQNKILAELCGKPVIAYSLLAFQKCADISQITVAAQKADIPVIKEIAAKYGVTKLRAVCEGGACREESVYRAITVLPNNTDFAVIHDGARPMVTPEFISRILKSAKRGISVACGVPAKDTVVSVNGSCVNERPCRVNLRLVQTPQIVEYLPFKNALDKNADRLSKFTDDCSVLAESGVPQIIADGDYRNIKVTTPEDLQIAELFLSVKGGVIK